MVPGVRPPADSFEVRFPGAAARIVRALALAPVSVRRRVMVDAFARAERSFNRGDFDAVFAVFAENVEYVPPPPLYDGPPLVGRQAVRRFWRETTVRFDENRITNLSIEEMTPARFVRTAELVHRSPEQRLQYRIRQTTEIKEGRVVRQINELVS
jgi:ketosteroid isomerase-like protein